MNAIEHIIPSHPIKLHKYAVTLQSNRCHFKVSYNALKYPTEVHIVRLNSIEHYSIRLNSIEHHSIRLNSIEHHSIRLNPIELIIPSYPVELIIRLNSIELIRLNPIELHNMPSYPIELHNML